MQNDAQKSVEMMIVGGMVFGWEHGLGSSRCYCIKRRVARLHLSRPYCRQTRHQKGALTYLVLSGAKKNTVLVTFYYKIEKSCKIKTPYSTFSVHFLISQLCIFLNF